MKSYVMWFTLLDIIKMKRFKFFNGIDDGPQYLEPIELEMADETETIEDMDFDDTDPSWMWAIEMGIDNIEDRETVSITCRGIREFLNNFPRYYIVPMVSISNGTITHTGREETEGWGFEIREDILTFVYVRI